ncbi:uncharacterized protein LOC141643290 [Silene latifolia]|uniref:uncharacterized protein LOC141643290 n=1 Tax=Silene latifolia TaxID=37657 RepID=UPI003D771ED2
MQQQMVRQEEEVVDQEELNEVKAQLSVAEKDKNHAFDELREIKLRLSKISAENNDELSIVKESLQDANKELKSKDKTIQSLQEQVDKFKKLESTLSEKDDEVKAIKEELSVLKEREGLISDSRKKVEELEAEVERSKETEAKLFESFVEQKDKLQEASLLIDKHKVEAASLREKMESEEKSDNASKEKVATIETKSLLNEIDFLKNELKRAMEAEENKDKALEDLALALKEVVSECTQVKDKLLSTEQQLEAVKEEAANLKKMVKSTEGTYEALLREHKKENDRLTNIVNRQRLEADESLLAWSGKEIEFVKCIRKAEDEKNATQVEYNKLMKSMREVEEASEKSKEEGKKLRDILKQALNEANVAKEAAGLARSENSYLQDALAEKDKALITLAQETERLRISEAEANESIKELKRVLTSGSKKEVAKLEKESKELKKVAKKDCAADTSEKEHKERKLSSTFSFDLNQFWPSIPGLASKPSKELDDEQVREKDDALGGSIFDLVESPEKDSPAYHRRASSPSSSTDEDANLSFEDEDAHFDDIETERNSQVKKKALLRRFGDLLKRKNSHPPKDSHTPKDSPHPPKDSPHPPKDHPPKDSVHPPKDHAQKDSLLPPKDHPQKDPHLQQKDHTPKDSLHPPKEAEHSQKEIAA